MEHILSRLEKVKQTGSNTWAACCPSHADNNPSLALKELPSGKILVKCWSGCTAPEIMEAMGLRMRDLNPNLTQETLQEYKNQYSQAQIDHAQTVLNIAQSQRRAGKRLSQQDLEAEMRAFKVVNG